MSGIISYVAEDFGIRLTSVEAVDGGVDRAARNLRGRDSTAQYAVKWSSGGSVAGLVVPDALARRGVRGVAAPVAARDGRLWSEREGRRLSVVPWVGRRRGIEGGLDADQWRELGRVLAAAHALPVTAELAAVLPVADHRGDIAEARKADALLRGAEPADETADRVRKLWLDGSDLIDAAAARVEELAPAVPATTVCHTDPHLGNVLAAPGRVWLIDWDDAALSAPEHDLMFVLGGAYGDEFVGDEQRAWFFEGYGGGGEASVDPVRLAYWRGSRGLVDVAFLAEEAFTPQDADGDRDGDGDGEAGDAGSGDSGDSRGGPGGTWRARAAGMLADALSPTGLLARALT